MARKREGTKCRKRERIKWQKCDTCSYRNLMHTHPHCVSLLPRTHTQHTCKSNIYTRSTNTRAYVRIVDLPLRAEIQAASRRQRKEAEGWRRSRRRCVREWRRDVRRRHASRTPYDAAPPTDNGVLWRGPTTKGATSDKHRPFPTSSRWNRSVGANAGSRTLRRRTVLLVRFPPLYGVGTFAER